MPKYEELNGTQQGSYDKLQTSIKEGENIIDLLKRFSKEDLLKILTTVVRVEFKDGKEHTLTPLGYAISLQNQLNSHRYIKNILAIAERNNILEEVLTNVNIKIKSSNGQKNISTPLAYAITTNNQRGIKAILDVAKSNGILEKVLNKVMYTMFSDGREYTVTPLAHAMTTNNQGGIKAILDVAKSNGILEKVLNKVMYIRFSDGKECTVPLLGRVIDNQRCTNAILDVAKSNGILEKVLNRVIHMMFLDSESRTVTVFEGVLNSNNWEERTKTILKFMDKNDRANIKSRLKDRNGLNKIYKIEMIMARDKSIIIGCVCGAIATLAVGIGCNLAGVSALIGIAAVAAVLAVGIVAGVITYATSKPSENLDRANVGQGVGTGVNTTA